MIKFYDCLSGTPALPLLVLGWAELLEKNQTDSHILLDVNQKSLVYQIDGVAVGAMSFLEQSWENRIFICMAYVYPLHRRQRIHTLMWEAIVARARNLGVEHIESGASVWNHGARASMLEQGRTTTHVFVTYKVPELVKYKIAAEESL